MSAEQCTKQPKKKRPRKKKVKELPKAELEFTEEELEAIDDQSKKFWTNAFKALKTH